MYCIYNISLIGRDVRKPNIDFIEILCPPMKRHSIFFLKFLIIQKFQQISKFQKISKISKFSRILCNKTITTLDLDQYGNLKKK
jgi:hypothetical protein